MRSFLGHAGLEHQIDELELARGLRASEEPLAIRLAPPKTPSPARQEGIFEPEQVRLAPLEVVQRARVDGRGFEAGGDVCGVKAVAEHIDNQLHPVLNVRGAGDLERAFDAVVRSRVAAVLRMVDPTGGPLRVETSALALRHRLPVMYSDPRPARIVVSGPI